VAPRLAAAAGWRAVWWAGAGFAFLALLLYGTLMRVPPRGGEAAGDQVAPSLRQALTNRDGWMLALIFFCFIIIFSGISVYFPTFLHQEQGYTLEHAGLITSVFSLVTFVGCPLAGALSDRLNTRRLMMVGGFLVASVLNLFPYRATGGWVVVYLVVMGLTICSIPTGAFSAAPEVMGGAEGAGMGLALVMLGQNVGMMVGPVLFAALVGQLGWVGAGYSMIPVSLIAAAVAWRIRVR
jgi:predicted MFS family arabinose efflux permease